MIITVVGANGTIGSLVSGILVAFCCQDQESKLFLVSRTIEKSLSAQEKAYKSVRGDSLKKKLIPKTYDDLRECVSSSDWVFESVSENDTLKREVHFLISKYRRPGTIVSTGTSGLSVESLALMYDEEGKTLFFGTHFFNPPYNLPFMEFIQTRWSDKGKADSFFHYLEEVVKRKAIFVKDCAAFLGNRIGFVFLNEVAQFAEKYQERGGIDYIDAIMGPFSGRTMAPLETIDFVGLDTHEAIIQHLHSIEPLFFPSECTETSFIHRLVIQGKLGRKRNNGLYRATDGKILVYDIEKDCFREKRKYCFEYANKMVDSLSDGLYQIAIDTLKESTTEEASICRYLLIKYLIISYESVEVVSDNIADADIAMSYGFNWVPPSVLCKLFGGRKGIENIAKNDSRIAELVESLDLSILEKAVRKTDIDYRRYFKASLQ